MWIEILKEELEKRGLTQVAKDLELSKPTVSLVSNGKYPANTKKVEERIMKVYGTYQKIGCPILGAITQTKCVETRMRARLIGMKAGNPETLRLYKTCETCNRREVPHEGIND
jgi:transcriptional regulator with XRE-family HTH domain